MKFDKYGKLFRAIEKKSTEITTPDEFAERVDK